MKLTITHSDFERMVGLATGHIKAREVQISATKKGEIAATCHDAKGNVCRVTFAGPADAVAAAGSALVAAKRLPELVSFLRGGTIELRTEQVAPNVTDVVLTTGPDRTVTVATADGSAGPGNVEAELFAYMAEVRQEIDARTLRKALRHALMATGSDRPDIDGVLLRIGEAGEVQTTATDGHRLHLRSETPALLEGRCFLLPTAARLLAGAAKRATSLGIATPAGRAAYARCADGDFLVEVIARTDLDRFPKWESIWPSSQAAAEAVVDRQALLDAISRIEPFGAKAGSGSFVMALSLAAAALTLETMPKCATCVLPARVTFHGEEEHVVFLTASYLTEAVRAMPDGNVRVEVREMTAPVVVRSGVDATFIALVMRRRS